MMQVIFAYLALYLMKSQGGTKSESELLLRNASTPNEESPKICCSVLYKKMWETKT